MQVSEIMSRNVTSAKPDDSLQDVARRMAEQDIGSLPVLDGQGVQGMVTDRDIVIRGVARGVQLDAPIREVMTEGVECVRETDDLEEVHDKMSALQVRRLPVLNDAGQLVGMVALADVARSDESDETGETLEEISESARQH